MAGTINALAGGGGLITFPLLMLVVTPGTADATSAVALFFAYPAGRVAYAKPVGRCFWSGMVMAASDSKCGWWFGRSYAAEPDG